MTPYRIMGLNYGALGQIAEKAPRRFVFASDTDHFINIEVQDMQGDASLYRISMKSKTAETSIK